MLTSGEGVPIWLKSLLGIMVFGGLLYAIIVGTEIFSTGEIADDELTRFANLTTAQRADMSFDGGDWVSAARNYKKLCEEDQFNSRAIFRYGYSLHQQQRYEEALSAYTKALDYNEVRPYAAYNMACIQALTNQPDAAIKSLRDAIENGFTTRQGIENDRDFASLVGDPEFKRLVWVEDRNRSNQRTRR